MDGLLIVDKPSGPTSHDVVSRARRALAERRIGHTGTLDPSATGVLPLVLGRATRLARFLSASDKCYEAVVRLGIATDTYDAQGTPTGPPYQGPMPSADAIERALASFRGTFEQRPPAYSAKKIAGRRSYDLARSGHTESAVPASVSVTVHRLDLVAVDGDRVTLCLTCSAGFYVRALAHELGDRLGTRAHLLELRRTRLGDLTLADAVGLDVIERDPERAVRAIVPPSRMLPGLSSVTLTEEGARRAAHGRDLAPVDLTNAWTATGDAWLRLMDPAGELVAIGRRSSTPGLLHPSIVLV